jgi:hypothetical protein
MIFLDNHPSQILKQIFFLGKSEFSCFLFRQEYNLSKC